GPGKVGSPWGKGTVIVLRSISDGVLLVFRLWCWCIGLRTLLRKVFGTYQVFSEGILLSSEHADVMGRCSESWGQDQANLKEPKCCWSYIHTRAGSLELCPF